MNADDSSDHIPPFIQGGWPPSSPRLAASIPTHRRRKHKGEGLRTDSRRRRAQSKFYRDENPNIPTPSDCAADEVASRARALPR